MRPRIRAPFTPTLRWLALLCAALLAGSPAAARERGRFELDTAFTYQGRLQDGGLPAEGAFDLTFELYDAPVGGTSLGRIDRFDVPIRQGAFAAELDYGHSVFAGDPVWLEIQVRPAGEGAYTALDPRHRLTGEGVSTCTVDSYVLINGRLDIDPPDGGTALGIPCCDEAGLAGGGRIELAGFLQSLGIDNNEIQSRGLGGGAPFWINPEGGNVGLSPARRERPSRWPAPPTPSRTAVARSSSASSAASTSPSTTTRSWPATTARPPLSTSTTTAATSSSAGTSILAWSVWTSMERDRGSTLTAPAAPFC
jgi:hypothetical protein